MGSLKHVFTDADLDGAISYLVLCWFTGKKLPVTVTTKRELPNDLKRFINSNNLNDYSRVYILDLSVCDVVDVADKPNFVLLDHHPESVECVDSFKNAKVHFAAEGSACRLLYKKLKEAYKTDLTTAQKILISLGHDYDSYTLKNKELAIGLNTLFWNYQGNRLEKFCNRFKDGFENFTQDEIRAIAFYRKKIEKFLNETPIYVGDITIKDSKVKFASIMCDFCINEIAQAVLEKTKCEVCVVVNTNNQRVMFRRSKDSKINMGNLALKLCEGGGHEAAAGGKITNTFLEFTKLLTSVVDYGK
jgi:oligoribonuclease NrnB/cAMP/cGMP phosphodiesterase (DHH superfamily)